MHLAADEGHRDVAQILGVKSANCSVKDQRGLTPLHLASSKNHSKMVNYLVKKPDAELDTTDDLGKEQDKMYQGFYKLQSVDRTFKVLIIAIMEHSYCQQLLWSKVL